MKFEVYPDDGVVALAAAAIIASDLRAAVSARGKFSMALSGGHTPRLMLRALAEQALPWEFVQVFQVDERVAPLGDADRNFTHLRRELLDHTPLPPDRVHAMAVEAANLYRAAEHYAQTLRLLTGEPAVLDLVHLGLGADGHTASLVPDDPALDVTDTDVTITLPYQARRRMTLTFPIINRSRRILWLVTGEEKAASLVLLRNGDRSIPATRVSRDQALIVADKAAADPLGSTT